MFNELNEIWITNSYMSLKGILIPSMKNQLSKSGLFLDLDSLPIKPYPFKELFIRWLISINKQRIQSGEQVIINMKIIMLCPLWKIIKCPIKKIELTKENMFNKPIPTSKTKIQGSINK